MPSELKAFLEENDLDGLLLVGDSFCDSDIFYLSKFLATDRFALLASDEVTILISSMERERAVLESSADEVTSLSNYDMKGKFRALGNYNDAYSSVLSEFLEERSVRHLGVPMRFPAGLYKALLKSFEISIVESPVLDWRAVKTPDEIRQISEVQRACEAAMDAASGLISRSVPKGGILYSAGSPLTSEKVRGAIEVALLERGCEAAETIVAGGVQSSNPHALGTGPLPADAPIVIDIFPRSKSSRYFADMTRTVLKGEPSPELLEMYDAVLAAQMAGLKAIKAGVSGQDVHAKVSDAFDERGYKERADKGFTHSTGHGVGLDIHEEPSLSEVGGLLYENNVVTVEPGLYYPEIGGIRLEDLVVVTCEGCDNLTSFEKRFVL
jgi:Xaa-Pro aminopeptidase